MRQPHLAAVAALDQIAGLQCIVRPAAVAAALAVFPFWLGSHDLSPISILDNKRINPVWYADFRFIHNNTCPLGRQQDYTFSWIGCQDLIG
jgi:hypothetical protein